MASFTVYDPKTKVFRALETSPDTDLTLEQTLLINLLIELRVIVNRLCDDNNENADDLRAEVVEEIGEVL